jgi:hypothetical protein
MLMRMRMRQVIAIGFLLVLLLFTSTAGAETTSFVDTYGPVVTPFSASSLMTLPQFDPSLGTLTKVTLTLDVDASAGSIDWDNEMPLPTDITLGIGAEVTALTQFGTSVVAIPMQLGTATGIAADNDAGADYVGSDAFSVDSGVGNDVQSSVLTLSLDMAPYIGIGTFDVTIGTVVQNLIITTDGDGPFQQTPGRTEGVVTVAYEYTPVSVPALSGTGRAVLIGFVLISMAALRFRRAA